MAWPWLSLAQRLYHPHLFIMMGISETVDFRSGGEQYEGGETHSPDGASLLILRFYVLGRHILNIQHCSHKFLQHSINTYKSFAFSPSLPASRVMYLVCHIVLLGQKTHISKYTSHRHCDASSNTETSVLQISYTNNACQE